MTSLDLRTAPPRGPRETLAGVAFSARVVDKLRAALPGGELNGYFPLVGVSLVWAHYTGIDLLELQKVVARAESEAEVERWIEERTAALDKPALNAKLARFDSTRMPEAMRPVFEATYPSELRAQHTLLFDLIEADDARLYPP